MDIGPILVSVCGLSLVCLGTLAVIAFIVMRTTGVKLWQAFGGLGGVFGVISSGEDDSNDVPSPRRSGRRSRTDLRARAQSLDFDAAVSRHSENPSAPSAQAAAAPAEREPGTPFSTQRPEHRRRRTRRDEDTEDEVFDSFADGDGDGGIDF